VPRTNDATADVSARMAQRVLFSLWLMIFILMNASRIKLSVGREEEKVKVFVRHPLHLVLTPQVPGANGSSKHLTDYYWIATCRRGRQSKAQTEPEPKESGMFPSSINFNAEFSSFSGH
jgi:uncharacterized protein (DUF58 family)